jgi:hypothetical protein
MSAEQTQIFCAPRPIAAVSVAIFLKEIVAKGTADETDHPPANYLRLISSNTDCSPLLVPLGRIGTPALHLTR